MSRFNSPIASLHRALLWLASVVLCIWVLSGFLHPLMALTAPRADRFQPPPIEVSMQALADGWPALREQQGHARLIRLVPGPTGPLWQLTDGFDRERRYLDLQGQPLAGGEPAYVRWLTAWYLGADVRINALRLQTQFDGEYPWVNRLLPVWRVEMGGDTPRIAWLHTETGTLASFGDATRFRLQRAFRALHTLDWLDRVEPLRVALVAAAMGCALLMIGSGLCLFVRRSAGRGARRWHRWLGITVALPLMLMAGSGLLHALVFAGVPPARGLVLASTLPPLPASVDLSRFQGTQQAVALRGWAEQLLLVHRGQDEPSLQVSALDGGAAPSLDELLADTARLHVGEVAATIEAVPHFSPDYDFRNRRLPAWVAQYATGERVAIDALTGQQLDRQDALRRGESWVFALAHKWQPVAAALGGSTHRDLLQVTWLALIVPLAVLGWRLRRRPVRIPASFR